MTEVTNRRNQSVTFTYDAADRVLSRSAPEGTASYGYSANDAWIAASNGASTDTVYFDATGRDTLEVNRRGGHRLQVRRTYADPWGELQDVELWDGGTKLRDIHYGYDAQRRLDTLTYHDGSFPRTTTFGYNSDRLPNQLKFPNGVTRSVEYSSYHREGDISYSDASADDALGFGYALDAAGRVDERWNAAWDTIRAFDFDAAGRLTLFEDSAQVPTECEVQDGELNCTDSERSALGNSRSYSYDLVGNRTDSNAQIQTGNRLTSFDGYSLDYDDDGNLISKTGNNLSQSLSWNSLGQLTGVTTDGNTTSFAYDAFGRRVRMNAPTYTRHYIHDGPHVFGELNGSYGFVAGYAYRPGGVDRPLLMNRGGGMYYYGTDLMGTVMGMMGSADATYRYDPWGETEYDDGTVTNPLRFAGAWRDGETDLYFMRARYYDPDVGRFISEDPIGLQGGINLYAFAGNNPVNRRDPSGLSDEFEFSCVRGHWEDYSGPGVGASYVCDEWGWGGGVGDRALQGAGWGGGAAGAASNSPDVRALQDPCGAEWAIAAVTIALDLSILVPAAGLLVKGAGTALLRTTGTAITKHAVYQSSMAAGRGFTSTSIRMSSEVTVGAMELAARGAYGYTGIIGGDGLWTVGSNLVDNNPGFRFSDLMPGFASKNAWNGYKACRGRN